MSVSMPFSLRGLAVCLVLAFSALPVAAQDGGPGDVITRQFEAFRQGDMEAAFSHASPTLKRIFGSSQTFGSMVRQGYPMVLNPDQMRLLDLREEGARLVQRVEVIDRKGVVHLLDYDMVETEMGWKINGVQFVQAPPVAA